jgi:hypothetical protein
MEIVMPANPREGTQVMAGNPRKAANLSDEIPFTIVYDLVGIGETCG